MPDVTVRGEGVDELRVLAVKIKAAGPKLRREVRKRLADQADPLTRQVRESILDMRTEHSRDGTLRGEVAYTVDASVSYPASGVRVEIVSRGSRMPDGMEEMPAHLNSPKGWAHPVYPREPRFTLAPSAARRHRLRAVVPLVKRGAWTWVRQIGKPGWFERPVIEAAPRLAREVNAALEDVRRELDR